MVWMSVNLILHSLYHLHHFKDSWDLIRRFLGLYLQITKSTIQTSKKHLCHANSVGGSKGGARGVQPPPFIFRPNWGPKGQKIFFWRPPFPPPPLSQGLDPALIVPQYPWCNVFFVFLIKSFNAFCIFLRLGNLALDFWAVSFGPGIVLGFVGSPKNFLGFWVLSLFDHPCLLKSGVPPWD